jgi:hypothetical protein
MIDLTPYNYPFEDDLSGNVLPTTSSATKKHGLMGNSGQSNCTLRIVENVKLVVYPCDFLTDYIFFLSSTFYDCFDPAVCSHNHNHDIKN